MEKTVRQIFSVFCLVMLGLMIWLIRGDLWTPVNWGMFVIALGSCTLVFVNFVYIFSYSYGLCVAFSSAWIWLMKPGLASALMAAVGIAYGTRLFVFTWQRMRSDSYAAKVKVINERSDATPMFVKVLLWVQCALLHTFHLMATYLVAVNGVLNPGVIAGIAIMFAGTAIESVADAQKQAAKAADPNALVTRGVFSRWRHPNYAGEILLHVGLIVAGLSVANSWWQFVVVSIAPVYIIILMVSEAVRVDALHEQKYGSDESYREYRRSSGSLLPGLGR